VLGLAREQRAAVQRTRKDRVAQLDLPDDDRAHVVLGLHAPGLGVGGAGGSALQVLELALRQVSFESLLGLTRIVSVGWAAFSLCSCVMCVAPEKCMLRLLILLRTYYVRTTKLLHY